MKTNHVKTQILPILDKIIAHLHNQSRKKNIYKFKKINSEKKSNFSTTRGEKSAKFGDFQQNNCLFTK